MKRGSIIHGVLLVVALLFAYQTWTREDTVERRTGDIKVWRLPADSITSVVFENKLKTVRMDKRTEGTDTYWWGTQTQTSKKKVKRPDLPPGPDGKPQTVDEESTTMREFPIGEKGEEVIEYLTELNALREISDLNDEMLSEYGLDDTSTMVTIIYSGGTKSLNVGAKVFSGKDRFVRDVDSGKAYAIAGVVLSPLMDGQGGLQVRDYHKFADDDLGKVVVSAGGQTREMIRITVESEKQAGMKVKNWADARTPDKPDQTMSNFFTRVKNLRAQSYEPDIKPEDMALLVKLEYKSEKDESLGWFELYEKTIEVDPTLEKPKMPGLDDKGPDEAGKDEAGKDEAGAPESGEAPDTDAEKPKVIETTTAYYIRTEVTRIPALVSKGTAERMAEDIKQMFGAEQE